MSQQIDSMMINNQSLSAGANGAQSVQASMNNDIDQNMSSNNVVATNDPSQ